MDTSQKHCIINAYVNGGWYPKGQERLERSLIYHGSTADHLFFGERWPKGGYDKTNGYNIKASVLEYAISLGYRKIIWNDCSQWYINNPMKVWDIVSEQGYFFWKSGFNCAQFCSDKCLEYFGIDRDTAEGIDDCSSSMIGLNLDNPLAEEFAKRWIQSAKDGAFAGSRNHDGQSKDPRFIAARQDQSCASLIMYQLGIKFHEPNNIIAYKQANKDQSNLIVLMEGI